MDPALYVRIEGVNLRNFIDDVHDLSTIRGGSFLLLDGVRRVHEELPKRNSGITLTPLSTGASSGLFLCDGWRGSAEELRRKIEDFLHDDNDLKHATFVVDVHPKSNAFMDDRESITAMNRWRQFQQPTLAVPAGFSSIENRECRFDHLRPAVTRIPGSDGQSRPASASVKARRAHGRSEKRRDFYVRELKALAEDVPDAGLDALIGRTSRLKFVNDFERLASDPSRGSLDSKIAIVYFDGNGFGSIQRSCDETALPQFDSCIKTFRRSALHRLLTRIETNSDGWVVDEEVRLETLLWGGDELMWVVPAWKGWEVAQLFYETSREWTFRDMPLTHAGGIVFCHHAAHIHRMTKLAKELADSGKRWIKKRRETSHAACDLLAYQILESFDVIGTELDAFRATRVPRGHAPDELLVRGGTMRDIVTLFSEIRKRFPRSKLHEIVAALRHDHEPRREEKLPSLTDDVVTLIKGTIESIDATALRTLFDLLSPAPDGGENPWIDERHQTTWFHMAELWDYVQPSPASGRHEEQAS